MKQNTPKLLLNVILHSEHKNILIAFYAVKKKYKRQ